MPSCGRWRGRKQQQGAWYGSRPDTGGGPAPLSQAGEESLTAGVQWAITGIRAGSTTVVIMPRPPSYIERRVAAECVGRELRVDPDGSIWRLTYYRTPCTPFRAELETRLGYLSVGTALGKCWAHRLVYQVFKGDIPEGLYINHLNGKKADNRPENIEAGPRGEQSGTAKLTKAEVHAIRAAYAGGETQRPLALRHGVTQAQISYIVNGKKWGHV